MLDSPATSGRCWAHFSAVHMSGYRALVPGTTVSADVRTGLQDGYNWVAEDVWPGGEAPGADSEPGAQDASQAYRSRLVLTADDGTVLYDSDEEHPGDVRG